MKDDMKAKKAGQNVLFLFTELSYYFLSCLNAAKKEGVQISVVHWPVNPQAPFQLKLPDHVSFFDRSQFDDKALEALIRDLNPDLLFCAGWMDKSYLKVLRKFPEHRKILTMDNQWRGTLRQHLAVQYTKLNFLKGFKEIWVPGEKQKQYALKLGFKESEIYTEFYSADLNYFNSIYQLYQARKSKSYPHTFLFIGRYVEEKGLDILIEAFNEFKTEKQSDWKLLCVGTGPLTDQYENEKDIDHIGFVQPRELEMALKGAGVFVLPSTFEPWGLVVHECAAAGLPLIVTSVVGSADTFVKPMNGWLIEANSKNDLKKHMEIVASNSDEELFRMAAASHKIAQTISPEMWAEKLISLLKQ